MNILTPVMLFILLDVSLPIDHLSTEVLDYCRVDNSTEMKTVIKLYMRSYNKTYSSPQVKAIRLKSLSEKIQSLNKRCKMKKRSKIPRTYYLSLNLFADLTAEEFYKFLGYIPPEKYLHITKRFVSQWLRSKRTVFQNVYVNTTSLLKLPQEVDWRNQSCISPVQMQGSCGSCWAFAALGVIESHYYLKVNNSSYLALSVQNLVDCSTDQGNQGCDGGSMENAYSYIIKNPGVNLATTYPYIGYQNPICKFQRTDETSKTSLITGWSMIEPYNEEALMQAIALVGPVAAAIDASSLDFQLYKSGVLCHLTCSKVELNHGILIVGYKTVNNIPVWIIKNSWSSRWGMDGYCYVCRNANFCGVATSASFPILANS